MKKVSNRATGKASRKSEKKRSSNVPTRSGAKKEAKKEALLRARERLNKKRLKRDRSMHWAHFWNVCSKCGGDMFEQKAGPIFFEVCRKCHGVYVDKAELELAIKFEDPKKTLRAILKKAKAPATKI